ncbi:MAG: hypothetical protein ACKVOM_05720 [Ferruginibacter sp.]
MDETLKKYHDELRNLIDKSNDSFEKQLNYISAGSLGLSMVIIEKIVKDLSLTKFNSILIFSWAFLGLTLISNLLSHVYSSKAHSKTYKEIGEGKYDYLNAVKRNKIIGNWNLISIALLLLGIILQILFITLNI